MRIKSKNDYNGWKNYETWNVALWIANDPGLYNIAIGCKDYTEYCRRMSEFLGAEMHEEDSKYRYVKAFTLDGVSWRSDKLDINALNDFIKGL